MSLLLIGYRSKALLAAQKLSSPIILWTDKKVLPAARCDKVIHAPISMDADFITTHIFPQLKKQNITAIYATTEHAVVPASILATQLNLPYYSEEQAWRCHDKYAMKQWAQKHHILTTDYTLINEQTSPEHYATRWGFPIVLKKRGHSGGRDQIIATDINMLKQHWQPDTLAEKFITGKEMSIESFCLNGQIIFSNITDYHQLTTMNIVPAKLDASLTARLHTFNQQVLNTFEIKNGMAHLEIYHTDDGIVFGELAIRPPGGLIMDLIYHSYGFSAWDAFIQLPFAQTLHLPQTPQQYTASWLIHPGAGLLNTIDGWQAATTLPGVIDFKSRLKLGKNYKFRASTGEYAAEIIFADRDHDHLLESLNEAQRLLHLK